MGENGQNSQQSLISARITLSEIYPVVGDYELYVKAVDLAGNESFCSKTPATYTSGL